MKTMKYLLMAVLMTGFGTAATAQDGSKADVDAVKKLISSKPADLDKQMKPYYKANKKNAENLVAFGRAFYEAKDTAYAKAYAHYALEAVKSHQYAPAYVLLGDICVVGDDGGAAAAWYEQAINADAKLVDAYYKYALIYRKSSPANVKAKLNELKQQRPDIETDAIMGHIFSISGRNKDAYESYSKVPLDKLERNQLTEFATSCFFTAHHAEGVKVCDFGITKFPRNATINRLGMMCSVEAKDYQKALEFADRFFNASDSVKKNYNHEYYYPGLAYSALKQHDKAIEHFNKALAIQEDGNLASEESILLALSNSYRSQHDFDRAAEHLQKVIDKKEKKEFRDFETLAKLYIEQSDSAKDATVKESALKKADAIYAQLGKDSPNNANYVLFQRANIGNKLDPTQEKGISKPIYEEMIGNLEGKAEKSDNEKYMLSTSYYYMMMYALHQENNVDKSKEYALKVLEYNPNNAQAKQISELGSK